MFTVTLSADGTKYIVSLNSHDPAFTGEQIATALNVSGITGNALGTGTFAQTTPGGTATSGNSLAPGYYLILSSLGTKLAVQTLDTVTIKEKNEYFTNTKTEDKANVSVGDTVNYTITVTIPATVAVGDEITVHDTLDDRLSIDTDSIHATIGGDATCSISFAPHTGLSLQSSLSLCTSVQQLRRQRRYACCRNNRLLNPFIIACCLLIISVLNS